MNEVTSVIDFNKKIGRYLGKYEKDSCRNSIRRAEKAGIVINRNQNFDEFYNIYLSHIKYKGYLRFAEDKQY